MKLQEPLPSARGRMRGLVMPEPPWVTGKPATKPVMARIKTRWTSNLVLRSWASIVGKLLATGETKYRISGMYIEFVNVASPGDPASIPDFNRDPASGVLYYDSLADSGNRDYLRVPMIATVIDSSDEDLYPDGNLLTFFAQTSGVVGVHGLDFGESFNSTVVGGALVAQLDESDATQDWVLSRAYFAEDEQIPKLDSGQVGVEWELTLQ